MSKATKAEVKNEVRKEFKLNQVFALWKQTSKAGATYFSGKDEEGNHLRGFYNLKKQNPNEPDLRVYTVDSEGNISKDPITSLWCNASKNGKKYLSGKVNDKRVVGFINTKASEKQPYITIYFSEDQVKEENAKEAQNEEIPFTVADPF